jgi:pyruvate dehydrogenase E2 component (dihydrolipoamide acetyltransferase)
MTRGNKLTGWRKIANALWDNPNDPQIYGAFELDASALIAFANDARVLGHRVTATHLVGRAVAQALRAVPDLNVRLVGDRAIARPSIDIFFITAIARGRDLSGVKIAQADVKSAIAISEELTQRSGGLRGGHDPGFATTKRAMERLPKPLLRFVLRASAHLAGERAISIPFLSLDAMPFGSAMVSSVGMLGIPTGFAPLAWMYRIPLLVLVGELARKPVAIEDRVEVRPLLPITATIDHRYVDGAQIGEAFKAFREYIAQPSRFEPAIGHSASTADDVRPPRG